MSLFHNRYRIESARCAKWDYSSPGFYFITICTLERIPLFGCPKNGAMVLNDLGKIASACWHDLPNHYTCMALDVFVVMPDHVHGIICLMDKPIGTHGYMNVLPNIAGATGVDRETGIVETGLKPVSTIPATIPRPRVCRYGRRDFMIGLCVTSANCI